MNSKIPSPIIIGIDPGYDRVGVAIGCKTGAIWQLYTYQCIQTDKKATLFARYEQIMQELEQLLDTYQVTEAGIESLFWFKNKSTALDVSEARGVIIATLLRHQIKISEYTPLQIKQSVTGYGRSDKKAVEKMVRLELGLTQSLSEKSHSAARQQTSLKSTVFSPQVGSTTIVENNSPFHSNLKSFAKKGTSRIDSETIIDDAIDALAAMICHHSSRKLTF